jgi:uncharacterized protein (DUF58 family)
VQFTRRYWGGLALAGLLAAAALAVEPLLAVGSAGLLAWLLASQFLFARDAGRVRGDLRVRRTLAAGPRDGVVADGASILTLSVSLARPAGLDVRVEQPLPVPARTTVEPTVGLGRGETDATADRTVTWGVAGRYALVAPTVRMRDRAGLFAAAATAGETSVVTVAPSTPTAYVSRGTRRVFSTDHPEALGAGLLGDELGETREYVPGDSLAQIDWKATARLGRLHVREIEGDPGLTTSIVLDARSRLAAGPAGRTKLDYLRGVALGIVDHARRQGDPVGLAVVSDDGTTVARPSTATARRRAIRRRLYDVRPAPGAGRRSVPGAGGRPPADADRAADRLAADDSAFAATLRPFYDGEDRARGPTTDPLYRAARSTAARRIAGPTLTVLLTDDADRGLLRQTVARTRATGSAVAVFLTPGALFDPGDGAAAVDDVGSASTPRVDVAAVRERHAAFESFRRSLDRLDGVSAFEVGPATASWGGDAGSERRRPGDGRPPTDRRGPGTGTPSAGRTARRSTDRAGRVVGRRDRATREHDGGRGRTPATVASAADSRTDGTGGGS